MASGWDKNLSDYSGGPQKPWPYVVALVIIFGGLMCAVAYRLLW